MPGPVLLKKLRPSRWIAILMFGWGACSTGLAGAHNYATVTGVRFLLGVFEAGLFVCDDFPFCGAINHSLECSSGTFTLSLLSND
jgi:hypothetical protein